MQLAFALGLTGLTVIIHALGTLEAIARLSRLRRRSVGSGRLLASERHVVLVVVVLLALHLVEAGVWAAYFVLAGVLPDLETAVYFSLTSYTTVGYGDVVLPPSSRLLGPIEAAVGILMFGWSTGIMVAAITRVYGDRLRPQPDAVDDEAADA
jgi:hypothetical protein